MSVAHGSEALAPFHHFAVFYAGDDEYIASVAPFVEEGVEAGEKVLVAVPTARVDLLRDQLSAAARDAVELRSMEATGRNPAWIIPAWSDFLCEHGGRAVRGVGEPVWPGRSNDELDECARHETLLNLAFADARGFSLLCPYDVGRLQADVVAEARCTHPHVVERGMERPSGAYRGAHVIDAPLTSVPSDAATREFTAANPRPVRLWAASHAESLGISRARINDLVVAVSELVTNSVLHGGGDGLISLWLDGDDLVCEVSDRGRIRDRLAGRVRPSVSDAGGRGLWIVTQLCDLVQVRASDAGQLVRFRLSR